jgi:hypothetical protein
MAIKVESSLSINLSILNYEFTLVWNHKRYLGMWSLIMDNKLIINTNTQFIRMAIAMSIAKIRTYFEETRGFISEDGYREVMEELKNIDIDKIVEEATNNTFII